METLAGAGYVSRHGKGDGARIAIAGDVEADVFGSRPVLSDRIFFFEDGEEKLGICRVTKGNAKIVDDQDEANRKRFVFEEAGYVG